ncbi:MAG: adenylate cyclase [Verrucomicrobiota bacterium]|jgi:serine/threonine-protein kinase
MNFFSELKRRSVYKVAVAYAIVGWLIVQIATQVFPFFEIPNWAVRLVVLVIVIGFPIAIVLAWAFELTPEGIKLTEDVDLPVGKKTKSRVWIYIVIVGAALSLGLFFLARYGFRNAATSPEVPAKSIAVLPFDNLSRDPDNAYFAEGIQDEILTRLSKLADFKVISRTSTQQFKSSPQHLPQIARQLGVMHILEGSVQRAGDQVRVNVQLIKASTDAHLWADSYDRRMTDIFGVESDIAQKVADSLQATLTGPEQHAITARPTENAEAHQLYLKGRFFWNKRTMKDFKTAISYFEQAAKADPKYAVAYAGMADAYVLLPFYGGDAPAALFPKAKEMAMKALALDPNLPEPHATLGLLHASSDFDFPASVRELERAIELDPNYVTAHHWLGLSTLTSLGQLDRAIIEMKRAVELDPLSVIMNSDLGTTYWYARRDKEAVAQSRKTLAMDETAYYAHFGLGQALEASGDLPAAIAEYEKATQLDDDPYPLALLAAAKAKAGQREAALTILKQLETTAKQRYVPDYSFALIHLALGEKDQALQWLESSYQKRQPDVNTMRVDPYLQSLHGDPRFETLAEKVVPERQFTSPVPK